MPRPAIAMTEPELARFLGEVRVVTCATLGPAGRPHLMPLWFVAEGLVVSAWTYAKSQKTRNLERRPQATLQVEAGQSYPELRGAMLECDVDLLRDLPAVSAIGLAVSARYAGAMVAEAERQALVAAQAPKRVGLRFRPTRIVSWDHRKLGGRY